MSSMYWTLFIAVIYAKSDRSSASEWCYTEESCGPSQWASIVDDNVCGGNKQSPIDLDDDIAQYSASDTLKLHKWNGGIKLTLQNTGHSIKVSVDPEDSQTYKVSGVGLPHSYMLAQFHVHFGRNGRVGSEHTRNGKAYPMEVHFVCFNVNYASVSEAADKNDGLAVIGAFFEIGDEDNIALKPIVDSLSDIQETNQQTEIEPFDLTKLLPEDTDDFYRYNGSLTTPKCYESVKWNVLKETISISDKQMKQFRSFGDIVDNYRPVQDLNGRRLIRTFQTQNERYIARALSLRRALRRAG